jgi:hypothetical protein
MGYFTINLPNNIEGEVRWGKVVKLDKQLFKLLLPWKKFNLDSKTGYIVKLKSAFVNTTEYRLFQTKEGAWSQDADGKVEVEDSIALAIRRAIEDHEKTSK